MIALTEMGVVWGENGKVGFEHVKFEAVAGNP